MTVTYAYTSKKILLNVCMQSFIALILMKVDLFFPFCRMAYILLAVLLFLVPCSHTTSVGFTNANCTYIVTPDGTCLDTVEIPCTTLNNYIQNASHYFQSNSTFCFLPGVHLMNSGCLKIESLSAIDFIGLGTFNQLSVSDKVKAFNFNVSFDDDQSITFLETTTVIQCDNSSGFFFNNITQLSFRNLTVMNCGANVTDVLTYIQTTSPIISIGLVRYVAVLMVNVSDLLIETTSIQNSTGYGFMGINILGQSQITGSSFVGNNQFVKNYLQLYSQTFTYCNDGSYYIAPQFYVNNAAELYAGGNAVFIYDEISNYSSLPVLNLSSCLFALGIDGSILQTANQKQVYFDPKFKSMGTGLGILMLQNSDTVRINIANTVSYRNQAFYGGNLNFQVNQMSSSISLSNVNSFRAISLIGGGLYYFINPSPYPKLFKDPDSLILTNSTFSSDYNYDYFGTLIDMSNQLKMNTIVQVEHCILYGNVVLQSFSLSISTSNPVVFSNSAFITAGCYGGIGSYQTKSVYTNCSFDRTNIYASQSEIDFIDSSVSNSLLSAFELFYSQLHLTGNVNLINNKAASGGGALYLYNSGLNFVAPLHFRFINNTAVTTGGAIYIYTKGGNGECIFHYEDINGTLENPGIHLYFEGNNAQVAGNVLYGGDIDRCSFDCSSTPKYSNNCPNMTTVLNKTATFVNSGDPSGIISSVPQSVCSCTNSTIDCTSSAGANYVAYPGQSINIPIITVGQLNGISPDAILSYTCEVDSAQNDLYNCTTPLLSSVLQQSQKYCINYVYQVIEEDYKHVFAIVLVPKTAYFNLFGGTLKYSTLITILPCPFGFVWNSTSYTCVCDLVLQKYNVQCNITTLIVSKTGTLWIGNTSNGILAVHTHCPYDYCKTNYTTFSFNNLDDQCDNDHSGVLCGGCKPNLSAVFGSERCKQCPSYYIFLLIPISFMGIVMMAFIFVLNCTVAAGTINGLILYANIVRPGIINLLPTDNLNGFTKFLIVFLDWMNLDLGIETCFYDSMDTYAKTWLQFLFPLYVLTLVGAVVIGSRWSSKLATLSKRNSVPVLATLILLSYTKLFQTTITIFSSTKLDTDSSNNNPSVWLADGNILYADGKHVLLFIAGLVVTAIFIIPYTSLLLLSPFLQAKSHWKPFQWINRLKPFIDSYQAPFKDQYRYWPGVHLMARVVLYIVFTTNRANDISINLLAIILVVSFYFGVLNVLSVYKNWLLKLQETVFLVNIIFLAAAMSYNLLSTKSFNWAAVMLSILCALLVFVVVVMYHVYILLKYISYFNRAALKFEDHVLGFSKHSNVSVFYSDLEESVPKLDTSMDDFYGSIDSREPLMEK